VAVSNLIRLLDLPDDVLETMERGGHVAEPAYETLQHQYETLGGYTLDQKPGKLPERRPNEPHAKRHPVGPRARQTSRRTG